MHCSICLEKLVAIEGLATTPCGHQFHSDCIASWILTRPISLLCPMCRAPTADKWCGDLVGEVELAEARAAFVPDNDDEESEVQVDLVCDRCNEEGNDYRQCSGACGHVICTACWTAQEHFWIAGWSQWMRRPQDDCETCLRCWVEASRALQASE